MGVRRAGTRKSYDTTKGGCCSARNVLAMKSLLFLVAFSSALTGAAVAQSPAPSPSSSPATQVQFSSGDIVTLLRAVQDSKTRPGITINVVGKAASEMPGYDPIVHFAGLDTSPTTATIWVSKVPYTSEATAKALWAAVELACMATGFAGPKWKNIYDGVAAADAAQPPGAPNPYKYRLGLTQQIKAIIDAADAHQ
jgi:hypothetical protein